MLSTQVLFTSTIAGLAAASGIGDHFFTTLLKRQEPGTPTYNCHDNCGTAITLSKAGGDVCKNDAFLTDYKACLQCAGPDNYDIWKYYSGTLSKAASGCGLSTTPLSGKQPDPGPAVHAGGSGSSSAGSATTSAKISSAAPSSAGNPGATATPNSNVGGATSGASSGVIATSPAIQSSGTGARGATSVPTTALPSGTGGVVPSENGTASFTSSPPLQTFNAASSDKIGMGVWGAIVLGAMFAV